MDLHSCISSPAIKTCRKHVHFYKNGNSLRSFSLFFGSTINQNIQTVAAPIFIKHSYLHTLDKGTFQTIKQNSANLIPTRFLSGVNNQTGGVAVGTVANWCVLQAVLYK